MSFIIEINGNEITSIEDLKANFDIDVLLSHRPNFDEWLFGWDYEDEATQVRELSPDLSDDDWLKNVCKIIGIPSATLTAAKRKRTSEAKKAAEAAAKAAAEAVAVEKEKASKKQIADKKKKAEEIEFEKLTVDFSVPDIGFEPFCLHLFVCEKGIVYYQSHEKLSISTNGTDFTSFNFYGNIKKVLYVNGKFIIIHGYSDDWNISFSENGDDWQLIEAEAFQQYEPDDDFKPAECHDIVWDGNQYVMLCSQEYRYDKGGFFSSEKWRDDYYIATAESLDGSWECNELWGMSYVYPQGLIFHNGTYFVEVTDGHEESGYDDSDNGIYYSDDAINWTQADSSDSEWLDGLDLDDNTVAWVRDDDDDDVDDDLSCYIDKHSNTFVYKNQVVFKKENNKLLAAKILDLQNSVYSDFRCVAEFPWSIDYAYLFQDNVVCISFYQDDANYEYGIGKIIY